VGKGKIPKGKGENSEKNVMIKTTMKTLGLKSQG
jgi:hypothetical protein